jgi:peptidyl-prolyl cis-trans isomerase B (cyclophilin B)
MSLQLSKFAVLALATSVTLSVSFLTTAAFAEDLSVVNPLHWMGYDSAAHQSKLAAQARKNAEMAEREADRLQKEAERATSQAEHAKTQAMKARQAAEALAASADEKKALDAEWSTDKPAAPPIVKEPSPASEAKAVRSASKTDAEKVSLLPENNIAPDSMDGQSQSDARSRLMAPDNLKDTLPGTSSDEAVRQGEKERQQAKTGSNKTNTSPWNPINWFNGSSTNQAKPPQTKSDAKDPDAQIVTPAPNNLTQTEAPNATSPPAEEPNAAPNKEKPGRAPLKAPQLLHKSSRKPNHREAQTPKTEEIIATAATADATEIASPAAHKTKAAVIETEKGAISIELFPEEAPLTVANFVKLANEGFYNKGNMRFHRVIPGFVIQTGDPTGTGAGGSKNTIPLEAKNKLSHNAKGMVAMARGGDPDSATSQFYVTLAPQAALDGKYAIFGKVVGGMDVLDKIEKNDQLYGVKIVEPDTLTKDPVEKKSIFSGLMGKKAS